MKMIGRKTGFAIAWLAFLAQISGCTDLFFSSRVAYDTKPLTIQTLSLFNQRTNPKNASSTWKGDWIFRRERLDLVDRELRDIKPDILVIQESLSKRENPSESDRNILLAGALSDYDWVFQVVKEYEDTQEIESLAISVAPPLQIDRVRSIEFRELVRLGDHGFVTVASVTGGEEPLTIFDVQMPRDPDNLDQWYVRLKELIVERVEEDPAACAPRVIVAGYLPGNMDSPSVRSLQEQTGLVDSSLGSCEIASRCYTSTPLNEIYMATIGDERSAHTDRIFVHRSARVRSGRVDFNRSAKKRLTDEFGTQRIWPTQRFGWLISAQFAKCPSPVSN